MKIDFPFGQTLLLFYLILISRHIDIGELLGNQMKHFIENNRMVQHTVAFILLLTIINITKDFDSVYEPVFYALIIYILFLLTTKLDLEWNLLILFLIIIIGYRDMMVNNKDKQLMVDSLIDITTINTIKQRNNNMNFVIFSIFFVFLFGGLYFYTNEKKIQFGGEYNPLKSIFQ